MLQRLKRILGFGTSSIHRSVASVEGLERRSLMSATLEAEPVSAPVDPDVTGPQLVKEQLIGSDPRKVEGIVLTFNEALDEASAEELRNFRAGKRTDRRQQNFDDDRFRRNRGGLIRFESAVYDSTNFTVTLTAVEPFNITRRFRTIRVLGRENFSVRDVAGNRMDGNNDGRNGGDAVEQFTFKRAGSVSYGELDGDSVKLTLRGPGRLWVVRKTNDGDVIARGDALKVFIDRADPASSILTGKVSGKGDGIAVIDELTGASTATVQIATDPTFQIVRSIP